MKNNKFVVIDVRNKTYSQYIGRKQNSVIVCDELLHPLHIEEFRINPKSFIDLPNNSPDVA